MQQCTKLIGTPVRGVPTIETSIVSLLPAATEIVVALGCQERLVGRSHECDFPRSVLELPICSKPRLDPHAAAATIHESVQRLVELGTSVFEVDAAKLRALTPAFIVTQTQCEVCAVSEDDLAQALGTWLGAQPNVVSLRASDLAGVWEDIIRVGAAVSAGAQARSLVGRLSEQFEAIRHRGALISRRPTVVGLEWVEPLMSSGNWIPELIDAAGGQSLLAASGAHSAFITWEQLRDANPDIVLISPCGFELERAAQSVSALAESPLWHELQAVQNRHVYAFDGHHFLHRPGPRLVDSAAVLAQLFDDWAGSNQAATWAAPLESRADVTHIAARRLQLSDTRL
ncbi:MAG: ABC transporter substrate-binding protein [Chromatiales bacterium]|nr:ABC transporter substrate-binding protein [Chromatiales bacterium]